MRPGMMLRDGRCSCSSEPALRVRRGQGTQASPEEGVSPLGAVVALLLCPDGEVEARPIVGPGEVEDP